MLVSMYPYSSSIVFSLYRTNRKGQKKTAATEEDRFSRNFIPLLNRLLVTLLTPQNEHLELTELDSCPRLDAFWFLGGIEPDNLRRKVRENNKLDFTNKVDDPVDR